MSPPQDASHSPQRPLRTYACRQAASVHTQPPWRPHPTLLQVRAKGQHAGFAMAISEHARTIVIRTHPQFI